MNHFLKIIFIILILSILADSSYSKNISSIKLLGNSRISNDTILNVIDVKKNSNLSSADLNNLQKKLFETNFFKNVKIELVENNLLIKVEENPLINFFYIDGIANKTREDLIYDNVTLGQNKIFSEALLKFDIDKIKDIYRNAGYIDTEVIPKITKLENNVVNLLLEVQRKEKYNIKRIFFIGDKFFKSSDLLDIVSSSEYGWWRFLSNSSDLSQQRLDFDKSLLKKFYLDQGFYDVQIVSSDVDIIDGGFANITYSINSGEKYKFNKFSIKDSFKNLQDLDKKIINDLASKTLSGLYSTKKINKLNNDIFNYLNKSKIEFVNFKINQIKTEASSQKEIFIEIQFSNVSKNYINLINIKGNSITEEEVVRRDLIFSEGDTFSMYKLKKSEDNLRSTGIFKNISTKIDKVNDQLVNLEISVEEQPTGSISAGVGIGTTGSSVVTGITEKNLFGKGIDVNSSVSLGTEKIIGNVATTIPDFNNTDNDLITNVYAVSTDFENAGYESKVVGGSLATKFLLFEDLSLLTGIGADQDKITTSSNASDLYKSRKGNFLTFKSFYALENDKRNRKFQPTNGHKLSFGQSIAFPGSNIPYIENNISASYYLPINSNETFSLKGGASSINAFNDKNIKLSDRKFLSNKQLRGFENYGVGPKDGKEYVGGNYSAYANLSSTFPNPLPDKLNAKSSVFLDFGNVWGVDYDSSKDRNKIRSSTGVGIDWMSPLGPIGLVFSTVLNSSSTDIEQNFTFQLGSVF